MSTEVKTLEQEFIEDYRLACKKAVEEYKTSLEPEDPMKMFYTRNWDWCLMESMDAKYQELVSKMWNMRNDTVRELFWETHPITEQAQEEMRDWFKVHGYDYEGIPPAPSIDHETPHKFKYARWSNPYATNQTGLEFYEAMVPFRTVYLVGSILVQPETYRGTKTIMFSVASMWGKLPIKLECSGSREEKKALEEKAFKLSSELSRLTDWEKVGKTETKVTRAIKVRLDEIKRRYGV